MSKLSDGLCLKYDPKTDNIRCFIGWHAPSLEHIPEGWWAECACLGDRWWLVCPP